MSSGWREVFCRASHLTLRKSPSLEFCARPFHSKQSYAANGVMPLAIIGSRNFSKFSQVMAPPLLTSVLTTTDPPKPLHRSNLQCVSHEYMVGPPVAPMLDLPRPTDKQPHLTLTLTLNVNSPHVQYLVLSCSVTPRSVLTVVSNAQRINRAYNTRLQTTGHRLRFTVYRLQNYRLPRTIFTTTRMVHPLLPSHAIEYAPLSSWL